MWFKQDKLMSCPIRGEGSLIKETSDFLEIKFANKLIRIQVWVFQVVCVRRILPFFR